MQLPNLAGHTTSPPLGGHSPSCPQKTPRGTFRLMNRGSNSRWLSCVVLAALAACNGQDNLQGLQGTLTVRTNSTTAPLAGMPSPFSKATVFLGDGRRFLSATDENGDVTFTDSRITGPMDVTLVTQSLSGRVQAQSILHVTSPELELIAGVPVNRPPAGVQVQGTVSGFDSGNVVTVLLAAEGASGGATAQPDGTYTFDVTGEFGGQADIFVAERTPSGDLVRAGMARDIALNAAAVMQDLSLTHTLDTTVTASLTGHEAFTVGTHSNTYLLQRDRSLMLLNCQNDVGVVTCPGISQTGPFADAVRTVEVRVGASNELPNGEAWSTVVVPPSESSVTVPYPSPAGLTAPALGPVGTPSIQPLSQLELQWDVSNDPSYVFIRLVKQAAAANRLFLVAHHCSTGAHRVHALRTPSRSRRHHGADTRYLYRPHHPFMES